MHFPHVAIAVLAAIPFSSAQLNTLAKKAGKVYFGTATDNNEVGNTQYFSILTNTSEFGQLTPGNGQKWEYVEPQNGVYNYTPGAVVVDIATSHNQIVRCHNLVWHNQLPDWVTSTSWTVATLTKALTDHVTQEVTHWKGKCYAWDVVNEALNDDGTFRSDVFYQTLGESYLQIAFKAAAAADPSAKLYYNDYNIEYPGAKSTAAQNIVKYLQNAGLKIDGVGLQSHFIVGSTPSIDSQISNMAAFTKLGVDVAITELDIRIQEPETSANLAQQKKDYTSTVGACMQTKRCVGVTVWDFYDPYSWVPSVFSGYGSADLWFGNYTKHPAYYGVVDALKNNTNGPAAGEESKKQRFGRLPVPPGNPVRRYI